MAPCNFNVQVFVELTYYSFPDDLNDSVRNSRKGFFFATSLLVTAFVILFLKKKRNKDKNRL